MRAYNHSWQINKNVFREIAQPLGEEDGFFHLIRNGVHYRMPSKFIVLHVPSGKYFIEIRKVNKFLEKVCDAHLHIDLTTQRKMAEALWHFTRRNYNKLKGE